MVPLAISKIIKYLRIFKLFVRFGLINDMVYRVTFIFGILVDAGYNISSIFFYNIIYDNIKDIGGWSYYEVMLLLGLTIISNEFIIFTVVAGKLEELPGKIKDGEIDHHLLRPVSSLFMLTIRGFGINFINMIPGFYLIYLAVRKLEIAFDIINILSALIMFVGGIVTLYCLMVMIVSLAFKFNTSTNFLSRLVMENGWAYRSKPHTIYTNIVLKTIFYIFFPVVYMSSIPADILINGLEWQYLVASLALTVVFMSLTIFVWNRMIRHYSSASS